MSQVLNHLLFHKAMIGIDTEKIDQYIEIAGSASSAAEVATVDDPFTRSVTLLFMLVKEHGLDPAQMALAFVNGQKFLTSNIIGATTMDQLKSNIASIDVELSKDVLSGIREIHSRWSNPAP